MRRTNIYLGEAEIASLKEASHLQGISSAEVVRRLIKNSFKGTASSELEADLAAIRDSFGVLGKNCETISREPDDRSRHLNQIRNL
ncbi:MAG: antitoxin [Candidatus Dormibacteraceae bacterium]